MINILFDSFWGQFVFLGFEVIIPEFRCKHGGGFVWNHGINFFYCYILVFTDGENESKIAVRQDIQFILVIAFDELLYNIIEEKGNISFVENVFVDFLNVPI